MMAQESASESESESDSSSSSDSSSDEEAVATHHQNLAQHGGPQTKWDKDHPHPGFEANQDDFEGDEGLGKYERKVPDRFAGPGSGVDADDQFMNSMISKYALEKATDEGKPTGKFVFKKMNAYQTAWEILDTHLGLKGAEAQKYLDSYFEKTWDHFNTANDGEIEADRMSGFFRFLVGNMQITLH